MDLTEQEQFILSDLEVLIRRGMGVPDAARRLSITIGNADLVARIVEHRQEIARQRRLLSTGRGRGLVDPEDEPQPWYTGPTQDDLFWPALRATLESDPGWRNAVPGIDQTSSDVVERLADPHSPLIGTRGLVLGHVQSGKTANFTATIAKAADAGYRMFIVLSGVHNALRRQTQMRLDQQLQLLNPRHWVGLTDEDRDFGNPVRGLALVSTPDLRLLAVVKKNVSRLTRLHAWLQEANRHGDLDTCPVLIIDDESDQASPNAARNAELNRTAINNKLVELLALPRVAYVGYTATPFANVLVDPTNSDDIYPRSFIYPLPKPPGYFGSRELFGARVSEEEETPENAPHDMVRTVPEDEVDRHSTRRLITDGAVVTECMEDAITWFLLATAARRARQNGARRHSSMLIHTTMRVDPQLGYLEPIGDFVRDLKDRWDAGDSDHLQRVWQEETTREPASRHGLEPVAFDTLASHLPAVLEDVHVVADNSGATERLVYGDDPATVIAVGGNTLSRGLTLEGLVCSYFLRSSLAYDSLLQMGRWFGYRPGYADLPRIWTSDQLNTDFRFLADIEDDLRSEIDRYSSMEGATPLNLPVRIKLHPRMKATAVNKMQFTVRGSASFSASRPQTTYFEHRNTNILANNRNAVDTLLRAATEQGELERLPNRAVLRGVDAAVVRTFVDAYEFNADADLDSDLLQKYMLGQEEHGALGTWNVVVIGRGGSVRTIDIGGLTDLPLITRSQIDRSHASAGVGDSRTANIGTLMSKPDRVADLDYVPATDDDPVEADEAMQQARDAAGRGLLLIYPINKDSQPKPGVEYRKALNAADDIFGVAFAFPTADPLSEPSDSIQVFIRPPTPEEIAEASDVEDNYEDTEGDHNDVSLDA